MPKALKGCPKSNKSPNLVTLITGVTPTLMNFADCSALQLNDEAILLNLSPSRSPTNGNKVSDVTDSGNQHSLNNNNAPYPTAGRMCLSAEDAKSKQYDVAYRDGKNPAAQNNNNNNGGGGGNNNGNNRTSWYLELVGCLRPVLSFMGKEKPVNQATEKGKKTFSLQYIKKASLFKVNQTEWFEHFFSYFRSIWSLNRRQNRLSKLLFINGPSVASFLFYFWSLHTNNTKFTTI